MKNIENDKVVSAEANKCLQSSQLSHTHYLLVTYSCLGCTHAKRIDLHRSNGSHFAFFFSWVNVVEFGWEGVIFVATWYLWSWKFPIFSPISKLPHGERRVILCLSVSNLFFSSDWKFLQEMPVFTLKQMEMLGHILSEACLSWFWVLKEVGLSFLSLQW